MAKGGFLVGYEGLKHHRKNEGATYYLYKSAPQGASLERGKYDAYLNEVEK